MEIILSKTKPIKSIKISNCSEVNSIETSMLAKFDGLFWRDTSLTRINEPLDMSSATSVKNMFGGCTSLIDGGVHFKNVPKDLDLSTIGCDASKYVIDSYKE